MECTIQEKLSTLALTDGKAFSAFTTIQGHEKHPFISEQDWLESKSSPEDLSFFDKIGERKFKTVMKKYSLEDNEYMAFPNEKEDLRIVLIGKTGVGKSATGNAILGGNFFEDGSSAVSVTQKSKKISQKVNGRRIHVIDTPGLHDTHRSKEEICEEIARVMDSFHKGVHAFIYVQDISNPRFTEESKATLEMIEENFGGGISDFRILVYSKADAMTTTNLDEFRKEQTKNDKQAITHFLRELDWRIVAVNNKTTIPAEKKRNQDVIIAMVDKLRSENLNSVYTSKMFKEAEKKRKELEEKGKRKGWNEAVMDAVDAVIAADPDIAKDRKRFNKFVQKHLEGKRDEAERELMEARKQREIEEKMRIAREKEEERANKEKIEREREEKRLKWERGKQEEEQRYRDKLEKVAEQREEDQRKWILQKQKERIEEMEKEWNERLQTEREEARLDLERQQRHQDEERERARKERERLIMENEERLRRTKQALHDADMARQAEEIAREQSGILNSMVGLVKSGFKGIKSFLGF